MKNDLYLSWLRRSIDKGNATSFLNYHLPIKFSWRPIRTWLYTVICTRSCRKHELYARARSPRGWKDWLKGERPRISMRNSSSASTLCSFHFPLSLFTFLHLLPSLFLSHSLSIMTFESDIHISLYFRLSFDSHLFTVTFQLTTFISRRNSISNIHWIKQFMALCFIFKNNARIRYRNVWKSYKYANSLFKPYKYLVVNNLMTFQVSRWNSRFLLLKM